LSIDQSATARWNRRLAVAPLLRLVSHHKPMNNPIPRLVRTLRVLPAACLFGSVALHAQALDQQMKLTPGGISPKPVITAITSSNQTIRVQWNGHGSGPFRVERCPDFRSSGMDWQTVGTVSNTNSLTLQIEGEAGFMRVQAAAPSYAGAERCSICHIDTHETWLATAHAGAFETLKRINQDKNPRCVACHTVGFGVETGFLDEARTPHLAGVQCENCHGPAGEHAFRPLDKKKRPLITNAAQMCGGCHTDAHHPTYDEWASSNHGSLEFARHEFADPTTGPARMATCGACHSGPSRLAMLKGVLYDEPPVMPTIQEATSTAITCSVCHNPHEKTGHAGQLRNPLFSKMNYSYSTSASFASQYNPEVNLCGQCHNMRGARWSDTSRSPHYSPQYNMLIGKGGFEGGATKVPQSAHMEINTQCAHCHTHAHKPEAISHETPAIMGHTFKPTMSACMPCHDEVGASVMASAIQANTKQQISDVKALLDEWAVRKAPEALQKYGSLAWEYNYPGALSPLSSPGQRGPTADEQRTIPDAIKQARFNLYLVSKDGSYGVHNGNYARFLLRVAGDNVRSELATP
jgi:hypothetical protein